jgi:hypothetical protein
MLASAREGLPARFVLSWLHRDKYMGDGVKTVPRK